MPNENEQDNRGGGALNTAIQIATPWYAFSALDMMSKMPTEGLRLPWTSFRAWRPGNRMTQLAEMYYKKDMWKGSRWPLFRMRGSQRIAEETVFGIKMKAAQAASRRVGGRAVTAASTAAMRGVAKQTAKGLSARFLVGQLGFYGKLAVAAYDTFQLAKLAVVGPYNLASQLVSKYKGVEMGGYFPDTQSAATSRQRAIQAITSSQLQARSAIGNEAMLFHR